MNPQPIIITEPRLVPRIIDALLTLLAWAGFIYLIYREYYVVFPDVSGDPSPASSGPGVLLYYGFFALLYVAIFILWAQYNQHFFTRERRRRKKVPDEQTLAQSFSITVNELETLNHNRVLRVHHDPSGGIVRIDKLSPAALQSGLTHQAETHCSHSASLYQ